MYDLRILTASELLADKSKFDGRKLSSGDTPAQLHKIARLHGFDFIRDADYLFGGYYRRYGTIDKFGDYIGGEYAFIV